LDQTGKGGLSLMEKTNMDYYKESLEHIPGGVNSPFRGFVEIGGDPICVSHGKGQYVYDVEGNEYVDFLLGFGPAILGHSPKGVIENVLSRIQNGSVFGATNALEIQFASMVKESTPSMDKVRFVCSGTEAVMSAVRLAKGYTSREKILKFDGSYHGHSDVTLGQDIRAKDERNTIKGIDRGINENTIVVPYNDIPALQKTFKEFGDQIACCIIEPYACSIGLVKAQVEFVREIRRLCDHYHALFIFDEVMVGFRVFYGSIAKAFGIEPDLITYGKVLGGGTPIGAYAGKNQFMELVNDREQGVFQAGTFAGNALTMAAGIATLTELSKPGTYEELERKGQLLEDRIVEEFKKYEIPYVFERAVSIFSITFVEDGRKIMNYDDMATQNFELFEDYHKAMLKKGFLLPPGPDEVMHLCMEHTDQDISSFAEHAAKTIAELRRS
jgi:glutamate-1-semialdehyde 2,1-aminomutase